jgi:hypothetical protein
VGSILEYTVYISSLLPFLFGVSIFKKSPPDLRLAIFLFSFSALSDTYCLITALYRINNIPYINIYFYLETIIILLLLRQFSKTKMLFSQAAIIFIIVYSIFWWFIYFIDGNLHSFNPTEKYIRSILVLIFCVWVLYQLASSPQESLTSDYKFWILIGILFYFATSGIVFASAKIILSGEKGSLMRYSWFIHFLISIITNLIFLFGLICFYRRKNYYY